MPVKCPICGRAIQNQGALNAHMLTHAPKCSNCGAPIKRILGAYPSKCPKCGIKFGGVQKGEKFTKWYNAKDILANTLGKGIYTIGRGIRSAGGFLGGAAAGAGSALAGRGTSKLKEHVWSQNQFDKLIWLGLLYYGLQWYYKLIIGSDVFSNVPYQFMILNFAIAIMVLIFFFKPDLLETIGTGLIIILYLFIMNSGFTFNIPMMPSGEIGTIISLVFITVIIALIWREVLHKDITGMFGISIIFLLESGLKVFLAAQSPALLTGFLLYWPYWLTLGVVAGSYTEETSKLVGFMRFLLILVFISLLVVNLLMGGALYGATQFDISEEKKEAGVEALKENWKNVGVTWTKMTAPLTCIGEADYQKCIAEKTAPPKKELTEEEKLLAVANKERDKKINLYFTNLNNQFFYAEENEKYEGIRISTQLQGYSTIYKIILLACSINEISGTITYPKNAETKLGGYETGWWEDIDCKPNEKLKPGNNKVEFIARWSQLATTSYPNYFMNQEELNKILSDYKTAGDVEQEKQCQFSQEQKKCLSTVKRSIYSKIPEFKDIQSDYPNFERIAKYDDEGAAIIIENTAPEIVSGSTKFNLRFSVANNYRNGEIVKVNGIKIDLPKDIDITNCDILEKNDNKEYGYKIKEDKLKSIEWIKVKYEKQKVIPGICELKIKDVKEFTRINIMGEIDFDYQLKNNFDVMVYG